MAPRKPSAKANDAAVLHRFFNPTESLAIHKEVAASDRGSAVASPALVSGGSAASDSQPCASGEPSQSVMATVASVDDVAQSVENMAGVSPNGTLLDHDATDEAAADVSARPPQEMAATGRESADASVAAPAGGSAAAEIQQSGDDTPCRLSIVPEVDIEAVPPESRNAVTPSGSALGNHATDESAVPLEVAAALDSGSADTSQTSAVSDSEPDAAGPNVIRAPDPTHLEPDTGADVANDAVTPATTNEAQDVAKEHTEPTEAVLVEHIRLILVGTDLESTSMRALRAELEQRLGLAAGALDAHRDRITELVQAEIARIQKLAKVRGTPARRTRRRKGGAEEPRSSRKRRRQGREVEDHVVKDSPEIPADCSAAPAGLTKADFLNKDWRLSVNVGGKKLKLPAKAFQSGGLGFYITDQVEVEYEGRPMALQCQISCAVIGSKTWEA